MFCWKAQLCVPLSAPRQTPLIRVIPEASKKQKNIFYFELLRMICHGYFWLENFTREKNQFCKTGKTCILAKEVQYFMKNLNIAEFWEKWKFSEVKNFVLFRWFVLFLGRVLNFRRRKNNRISTLGLKKNVRPCVHPPGTKKTRNIDLESKKYLLSTLCSPTKGKEAKELCLWI